MHRNAHIFDQPEVALIVAVAENGVIGRDGGLPWHQSSDLKTFRRLTMGKPIIMGRRTFQSIGKVLDGRDNIVVTRDKKFAVDGVSSCHSVADALRLARILATTKGEGEIMIIGGAAIFSEALASADRVYLTRIHASPEGDTFFQELTASEWVHASSHRLERGPRDDHESTLIVFERKKD